MILCEASVSVSVTEKTRQSDEISVNSISLDSLSVFRLSLGVGHEACIGPARRGLELSVA